MVVIVKNLGHVKAGEILLFDMRISAEIILRTPLSRTFTILAGLTAILLLQPSCSKQTTDYTALVAELELAELATTFNEEKTKRLAPKNTDRLPLVDRQSAALLASLGLTGNRADILGLWTTHPIYLKLNKVEEPAWLTLRKGTVMDFASRLTKPLEASISTGYNIVPGSLWPQFDPDRTVVYGHNDWKHAKQLCALLHSEGLKPSITVLQKQSAFIYNDDWGEPTIPLVPLKNGKRLVVGVEFDLFLEFEEKEDVERFAELVTRFAKKDSPDEAGLIHDAWWQPFYRTFIPTTFGQPLTVMLVQYQGYRANLISLPKDASEKIKQIQSLDPDWTVEPVTIWVNPAFYRFQLGDYR